MRLTAKQVRERLINMVGSDLIAEGVDPSTAMSEVMEVIDTFESFETEANAHTLAMSEREEQINTLNTRLLNAQEVNMKLLKKVDNGGTIETDKEDQGEEMTIDILLSDHEQGGSEND